VAKRSDAGTIEVGARVDGGDIVLSVQDDGPGYRAESGDAGVGLANTRARLETLFGGAGQLQIAQATTGGTIATVRFPLRRAANA
jgi:LytS/YehU family sensor histidine kinase